MRVYCSTGMGRPLKVTIKMGKNSEEVLRLASKLADNEKFKRVYIKKDRTREELEEFREDIQRVQNSRMNQTREADSHPV